MSDCTVTTPQTTPHVAHPYTATRNGTGPRLQCAGIAKPTEPTGLGAVVIDNNNLEWVKADYDEAPWFQPQEKDWRNFDDVDAVEVKSPGVQL